jgi:DNA-binding protein
MSSSNANTGLKASNEVFVGKKPLMTYVTATLVQLANEPTVIIKARGKSITRAVDVAQIIVKRMDTLGYKIGPVNIGSELIKSQDGKTRNVSTIEVSISRQK